MTERLTEKEIVKIGKFMAYLLRHHPEAQGLEIDREGGWVSVDKMLQILNISLEQLEQIVRRDSKGRFSFENGSHQRIRANYGHSIDIELDLDEIEPPDLLYHGTAERKLSHILKEGIKKMNRRYVHLSKDFETAVTVGRRHGKATVIVIDAKMMHNHGKKFFLSGDETILTESVHPRYFKRVEKP